MKEISEKEFEKLSGGWTIVQTTSAVGTFEHLCLDSVELLKIKEKHPEWIVCVDSEWSYGITTNYFRFVNPTSHKTATTEEIEQCLGSKPNILKKWDFS